MLPAITVPALSGDTPDWRNTSRAALIPRSIGDTSPSTVLYSAKGVRTPSSSHTSSYCEIKPLGRVVTRDLQIRKDYCYAGKVVSARTNFDVAGVRCARKRPAGTPYRA